MEKKLKYAIYVNDFNAEKHKKTFNRNCRLYWIDAYTNRNGKKKDNYLESHQTMIVMTFALNQYINGIKKALRRHSVDIITYTVRK